MADYRRLGTFVPGLFYMPGESIGTVLVDSWTLTIEIIYDILQAIYNKRNIKKMTYSEDNYAAKNNDK